MSYESWRISYQGSEQAARAAYNELTKLTAKVAELEGDGWVSVDDRLPEDGVLILYYFEITGISVGKYDSETNTFYGKLGFLCGDVTHWQPLPKPPAMKAQDE